MHVPHPVHSQRRGRLPLVVGVMLLASAMVLGLWSLHVSGRLVFPPIAAETDGLRPGQSLPDLTLRSLDGALVRTASFRGSPLLLNFWATWCVPCRYEMPELESVYRAYRQDGLIVLGVNVGDDIAEVESFRQEIGVSFPMVLDQDGQAVLTYRVTALPTTIFVDRHGTIRDIELGAMSEPTIGIKIRKLLAQ